ncbi:helix-turn-helix transcriptional regulator [Bradyrhizobium sp.]|uniref:helix-turn-helix transcriptional regulator n=1 Tax=Bradyrhizobium sp. TaxID=376 RepID=UPI0023A41854|nr:helix-turn-helix transcriptional regulator [Bradyrhizobium sp.]MDE1936205.1 helix-turn-helix transcriptional regulator [Bradyrhizobium sp.]
MRDTDSFDRLTDLIYDAALDAAEWPRVLHRLASAFGASSAHLSIEASRSSLARLISFGTDPAWGQRYAEYYGPRNIAWQRMQQRKLHGIFCDRQVLPKEEFRRSEFYNDFLCPQDGEEILGSLAVAQSNTTGAGVVTLWRPERFGPWQSAHLETLTKLTPHLSRAIRINLRMGELQTAHHLTREALYGLNCGVILATERGTVEFINKAAEAVLADGALRLEKQQLAAGTSSESTALKQLVANAAQGGDGGSLVICREGRPCVLVLAIPARAESCGLVAGGRGAIVFVRDLERPPQRCLAAFADHFGLTPAQAALAQELLQGDGLAAVAARLGITHATAKTHLMHIFQKTGVRRQAELVRLMLEWVEATAGKRPGERTQAAPRA